MTIHTELWQLYIFTLLIEQMVKHSKLKVIMEGTIVDQITQIMTMNQAYVRIQDQKRLQLCVHCQKNLILWVRSIQT